MLGDLYTFGENVYHWSRDQQNKPANRVVNRLLNLLNRLSPRAMEEIMVCNSWVIAIIKIFLESHAYAHAHTPTHTHTRTHTHTGPTTALVQ